MIKVLFLVFSFTFIYAQDAFVSAEYVKKSSDDEKLVIIDVSDSYNKGHMTGAISFDVKYMIDKIRSYDTLKSHKRLQEIFSAIGLKDNSNIIIYGRNNFQDLKYSAYLAFVLISSGFENVSILDGGYMSLVFEDDLLITKELTTLPVGNVTLKEKNLIVEIDTIKTSKNSMEFIDARYREVYNQSHIIDAKSSPYSEKFNLDYTIVSVEKLQDIYLNNLKIGIQDIVVYSDDIFTSSLEWFIINRVMGFSSAKIYYNSFGEYKNLGLEISSSN